jgi:hypothetical protein
MKYEKIEDWLETLTGEDRREAFGAWYDHVEKFTVNPEYTPHRPEFMALWARYTEANS